MSEIPFEKDKTLLCIRTKKLLSSAGAFLLLDVVNTIFFLTMKSDLYKTLLKTEEAPYLDSLRCNAPDNYIYQHDNAKYHTSSVVKTAAVEKGLTILDWPLQSPDLNPIENLWAQMKFAVGKN